MLTRIFNLVPAVVVLAFIARAAAQTNSPPTQAELRRQVERCRTLLQQSVIDFYLPHCLDKTNGGYLESLGADGKFRATGERFLTLQARQVWFFSTLAAEGIHPAETLTAAKAGFDFLQSKFHDAANGGYFSKVSDVGQPTDRRKHAYLNSFALYSLAAYHRATRDPAALDAAKALFAIFDAKAHDAANGGYHEFFQADWQIITNRNEPNTYVGPIGIKTYNTHLHLLESFAELYRVWPEERLARRLAELLQINTSTVKRPDFNCNVDQWYPNWEVVDTPRNLRASYGHDVECAWLALDAARTIGLSPRVLRGWAVGLVDYSLQHGYDAKHGGFFNGGALGAPADDRNKVWWVQSEALVSMLELYRLTGNARYYAAFAQTLDFIEKHQIASEGGWWATRAEDGSPSANRSRTSMWQGAYHNGRALLFSAKLLEELAKSSP